ncbi:MAG: hypothetical protein ABIQ31_11715 [Ferruginibacter sp.]
MKSTTSQTTNYNTKFNENKKRPEIRDNMDSREGEEQEIKGDDTTHNQKAVKSKNTGDKKK